ncbi:glycosyltransferase family 4 protein [Aeromonas jandaei]|uniref:glycosyltransferase family 4 protein n=1 Tax=Aeromonas jandaei TaxID=650 RepID=UPI003670C3C8
MKKILLISHSSDGGGAETVFLKTCNCLMPFCELSFFMPKNKGYLYDEVRGLNGNIYVGFNALLQRSVLKNILKIIFFNFFSIFRICWLIHSNKIDVVYSSTIINYIGVLASLIMRKRHIWHIHEMNNPGHIWIDRKYNRVFRFLFKRSELIFVANGAKESWLKYFNCSDFDVDCHVIYNPIKEIQPVVRNPRSVIKIGFAGSYGPNKNLKSFVNVMVDIIKEYDDVKMFAVGKNIEENAERLIDGRLKTNAYALSDHVNIDDFMNDIDILVLPSFSESWGLVVFEAMSTGVIPIVTEATSLKEMLVDGVNLFYIDPNSEYDIYLKVKNVLNDFEMKKKIISKNNFRFLNENKFNDNFNKKILNVLACR